MGDTAEKQRMRELLRQRLDSYYETLMEASRRESHERWEHVIQKAERPQHVAS